MDPKKELSVILGTSTQSFIDKIVRDASAQPFDSSVRVPSHTTAYKGYVKAQRRQQKKPQKKTPHVIIEK